MAYRAVLVTVLVGIAFFIADSVWKFYIAPGDALLSIVNRCSEEANEGYGLQVAMRRKDHPMSASNPHPRERDKNTSLA
jgi:hypothetical protein